MEEIVKAAESRFEENDAFKVLSEVYYTLLNHSIKTNNFILAKHVIKKCTTVRIRSIYDLVMKQIDLLFPVFRELIFYIRRVTRIDDVSTYGKYIINLLLVTDSSYIRRWLVYLIANTPYKNLSINDTAVPNK